MGLEDFNKEIEKIREECRILEQKYSLLNEADFLNYLLDEICDIEEIEIEKEKYINHKTMYVLYKTPDKISLKRLKEDKTCKENK